MINARAGQHFDLEQTLEIVGGQRPAEVKTLDLVASI
jgi:hypothetical protein